MFKKLIIQIMNMLLDAKFATGYSYKDNSIEIYAIQEFQHSDHSKHYRKIRIKIEEEVD